MARQGGGATDGWYKSSTSGDGACVEIRIAAESVDVRNARDPSGAVLSFTYAEWRAFLSGVRLGEFEVADEACSSG